MPTMIKSPSAYHWSKRGVAKHDDEERDEVTEEHESVHVSHRVIARVGHLTVKVQHRTPARRTAARRGESNRGNCGDLHGNHAYIMSLLYHHHGNHVNIFLNWISILIRLSPW